MSATKAASPTSPLYRLSGIRGSTLFCMSCVFRTASMAIAEALSSQTRSPVWRRGSFGWADWREVL